jgi:hypothetical protein
MAIPNYTYLKLKISEPTGIGKAQQVLNCEQDSIELATAMVVAAKLRELSL